MNDTKKERSKINITTKSLSKKQVIISMSFTNMEKVIAMLSKYVTNINRALKNIKSEVVVDFIQKNHRDLVSNLNIIENYIKIVYIVNFNNIMSLRLPQSKLYLKILDITLKIQIYLLLLTLLKESFKQLIFLIILFLLLVHVLSRLHPNLTWPLSRLIFGTLKVVPKLRI